jgi:hypothetical protein
MVFYGPTAAVFERQSAGTVSRATALPAHGGLERLRNGGTALRAHAAALPQCPPIPLNRCLSSIPAAAPSPG